LLPYLIVVLGSAPALAQPEPTPPPPQQPPAATEPEKPAEPKLEDRVKALESDVEDVTGENEDLRSEVAELRAQQAACRPPISPNALKPAITAFLNGAFRIDDSPVTTPSGVRIDRRPFMRTAEVDFRAAVDPYADAVAIFSAEDEAGTGFDLDLEEGYVIVKRLPILESAPLGLKLKLGRYRAPIGNVNRLHMHDLPWTTRPLPIARFLGTENGEFFESGYNPVGADAEVILPEFIKGAVMEVNADIVDGGNIAVSDNEAHRHPGYLGHYNLFFTAADTHDFNIGLSAYYEPGRHHTALYSADFLYKWKPLAGGEFKSFVLGGEAFYVDRRFSADTDGDGATDANVTMKPFSWFAFAQYQLSWHVYLGGRYDFVQDITDKTLTTQVAAGYLSYYTSEFLRFRAGYEHRFSDVPADDGVNSFIAEVNVVFGSHPTEPYWVNR
jgi:hypothetical protein